jgi:hypothetical protein
LPAVLSAAVVRKYERPSVTLRSALLKVSNSTASDNTPRFNYGRGQAYVQNYGRGHGYRQNFGRGQDNRQNGYRVNPQKENSQTDKKSENVESDSLFCISVINFIMSV